MTAQLERIFLGLSLLGVALIVTGIGYAYIPLIVGIGALGSIYLLMFWNNTRKYGHSTLDKVFFAVGGLSASVAILGILFKLQFIDLGQTLLYAGLPGMVLSMIYLVFIKSQQFPVLSLLQKRVFTMAGVRMLVVSLISTLMLVVSYPDLVSFYFVSNPDKYDYYTDHLGGDAPEDYRDAMMLVRQQDLD